jgi:hypothetical protein
MLEASPKLRRNLLNDGGPPPQPGHQNFAASNIDQGAQGPFDGMPSDSIMADIINDDTNGPQSFTQQEAEAYAEDEEDGEAPWENDVYTYAEVAQRVIHVSPWENYVIGVYL